MPYCIAWAGLKGIACIRGVLGLVQCNYALFLLLYIVFFFTQSENSLNLWLKNDFKLNFKLSLLTLAVSF
jgi:hypothetical protein